MCDVGSLLASGGEQFRNAHMLRLLTPTHRSQFVSIVSFTLSACQVVERDIRCPKSCGQVRERLGSRLGVRVCRDNRGADICPGKTLRDFRLKNSPILVV